MLEVILKADIVDFHTRRANYSLSLFCARYPHKLRVGNAVSCVSGIVVCCRLCLTPPPKDICNRAQDVV